MGFSEKLKKRKGKEKVLVSFGMALPILSPDMYNVNLWFNSNHTDHA